ncbi:x-box binding protein [Anaeramoeba ignava]|uniref:X-box-binding protein 1 n=1 Tax=Anaeramoeba ignava TaxID=1746090 RepID=A0A9Q0R6I3_ANAIG|nr:x-box binding protein [Anaeramoeba ignava]
MENINQIKITSNSQIYTKNTEIQPIKPQTQKQRKQTKTKGKTKGKAKAKKTKGKSKGKSKSKSKGKSKSKTKSNSKTKSKLNSKTKTKTKANKKKRKKENEEVDKTNIKNNLSIEEQQEKEAELAEAQMLLVVPRCQLKTLTEEDKKKRRKLKNRISAKMSRERVKNKISQLENQVDSLEKENHLLKIQVTHLLGEIDQVKKELTKRDGFQYKQHNPEESQITSQILTTISKPYTFPPTFGEYPPPHSSILNHSQNFN